MSTITVDPPIVEDETPPEAVAPESEPPEPPEPPADAPEASEPAPAEEEFVVQIGDEQPAEAEAAAPPWVRDLRKQHRELARRNRELEERLAANAAPAAPAVGTKPTLEGCDYDAERYERDLAAWFDRKRAADAEQQRLEQEQRNAQRAWQEKLAAYTAAKATIKAPDYEDAEALVQEQFNVTQQGILLQGLENAALVVYALGKNPKRAKELAAITDPVRFAVAAGKLESQLKVTNRPKPPAPPRTITSTGPVSGAVDSQLERLRAEAERTGDYTRVSQYKRQQAAKR